MHKILVPLGGSPLARQALPLAAELALRAAEAIMDAAAQRCADLIVMATHGRGGLRRWALGSVADKVIHTTTTPLVLLRARASAGATDAERHEETTT